MHDTSKMGFATRQIHTGAIKIPGIAPLATPIFQSSTFVFDSAAQGAARFAGDEKGYIYTRLGNPNSQQVADKLASLEGAEAALALSSGMGAITTAFWTLLKAGDHVLADDTLYGCTFAFLNHGISRYGVDVTFTDFSDMKNIEKNLRPNTKAVYFESPCNPTMKLNDIEGIAALAHKKVPGVMVIVDNTFCTPYIQRPLSLGADAVVHSGTKYLNGHGDVISGMIAGSAEYIHECAMFGLKDMTGAVLSPFDSYLISRGMKTLDIRMEKHCANAMAVAEFLQAHKKVAHVYYPGLKSNKYYELAKKQMRLPGGIMAFELAADRATSEKFINSLELCTLAVSLGDAETLVEHPASMTHSAYSPEELKEAGIGESLIRLSVGLEDAQDIIADLKAALDRI